MAYAPILTFQPASDSGPPRVEVLFTSLHPLARSVTVFRLADRREYKVRGAVRAVTAGQFSRVDNEVPFGVSATYRAEMFDEAGVSLGFTDSASIKVDEPGTWLHNPLDPSGSVRVEFRDNAARDLSRPAEGNMFFPMGRRVGVVVGGQRRGLAGVQLDVIVDDVSSADRVQQMLGDYQSTTVPVLCFRVGAFDRVRLPKPFFASVFDLREQDLTYVLGGSQIAFEIQGDEVAPPTPALFISLLTRADVNAFYETRADVDAYNLTRLSVARNYSIGDGSGDSPDFSVESPAGSGLYTVGVAEQAPEPNMFLTEGFEEIPAGSGLFAGGGIG